MDKPLAPIENAGPALEINTLRGKEPDHFGNPRCLNTSSRVHAGGAIGPCWVSWPYFPEPSLIDIYTLQPFTGGAIEGTPIWP